MKKNALLLITMFALILVTAGNVQAQNLLTNPGFETWVDNGVPGPPDDWNLSGTSMSAEKDSLVIHGGTYSTKITWTTTSTRYLRQQGIAVDSGVNYVFSFWVFDNDQYGRARVTVRWFNSGGDFISGFYGDYSVDSPDWQQLTTGSLEAPATAVTADVEIRVYDVSWLGTASVYADDAVFEISTTPPAITEAYTITTTSMDVVYDKDITSVDPGDYTLSGTTTIIFSGATIDGTDAKIVHLTGASTPMVGDATLDNIDDDINGTNFDFYAGILPVAHTNASTSNPYTLIQDGYIATYQGIVSANDGINNVWVSDAAGQYNGIMIYNSSFDALVAVGDEIIFAAERSPYNNLSELVNPNLISTITSGNTPYGPSVINGSDLEYTIAADTDPAEPWEGQLVKINIFTVDSLVGTNYACSWSDDKATYVFFIGTNVDNTFLLTVGSSYLSVTGVVDWYWSGPYYRINSRNQLDIEGSSNPATQLAVVSVNSGVDPYENVDFEVVVQAQDALGDPAFVTSDVNFTFTTNGGTSGLVDFTGTSATTGTILTGTSEAIVTGVQMTPTGTNVTITANDDAIGLTSGTSVPFDIVEFVIPDIIITEIMQNPAAVLDGDGEFFEVFNNTDSDVDMIGWVIKDADYDSLTITSSVVVPAGGFAVLGKSDDSETNGGYICDYPYTSFTLANGDDEIILCLSDGITEVDRIEYDGGPVWPDPSGSSMAFTGFPNEDNNDGTMWVYSTFRESTYTGTSGDRGSPGSNGYDQILTGGYKLDLKVYLEGPFNTDNDTMYNDLRAAGLLPLYQPFNPDLPYYGNNNPAWLFSGTDTVSYIQYYAIDWLLVEIRDAASATGAGSGTMVAQYPAFLMDDGTVVSMNGQMPLNLNLTFSNSMYVVVWHRNHLGILSSVGFTPVEGTIISYDFTPSSTTVYGGIAGYKELKLGIWGMVTGDSNGDQSINDNDKVNAWSTEAGEAG